MNFSSVPTTSVFVIVVTIFPYLWGKQTKNKQKRTFFFYSASNLRFVFWTLRISFPGHMCPDKHRNSCEVQVFKPAPFRGFLPHLQYSDSHILPHLCPHYHPPPRMLVGVNLLLILNHSRDLAVQWLRLCTLISFGPKFDPWKRELRSLLASWPKKKKKKIIQRYPVLKSHLNSIQPYSNYYLLGSKRCVRLWEHKG